jgi:hypothetical protein
MNKLALLTITLLAAAACGDGISSAPATFGDGALDMSVAFCERSVECGSRLEEQVPYCIDSNVYELCSYWDCAQELTELQAEAFEQCTADLEVRECGAQLSDKCIEVLYFTTEPSDE